MSEPYLHNITQYVGLSTKRVGIRDASSQLGLTVAQFIEEVYARNLAVEALIRSGYGDTPKWVWVSIDSLSAIRGNNSDNEILLEELDIGGPLILSEDRFDGLKGTKISQWATIPVKTQNLFVRTSILNEWDSYSLQRTVVVPSHCRLVSWYGQTFQVSENQSRFLSKILFDAQKTKIFQFHHPTLTAEVSSSGQRFHDIFKGSELIGTFFQKIKSKDGYFLINVPQGFFSGLPENYYKKAEK